MDRRHEEYNTKFDGLIETYDFIVKGIDKKAKDDTSRAYGGMIRSGKGKLVENMSEELIRIAWDSIGGNARSIDINRNKIKIPLNRDYIDRVENETVREYLRENYEDYYYSLSADVHVHIDDNFVLGVECKAYTENAMIKRILVDFSLLMNHFPDLECVLFQLESQLGGDYSNPSEPTFGSRSTHTLMSYYDLNLNIITLLEGERKVDKPIHKSEFYKPLSKQSLINATAIFEKILKKHV